MFIYTTLMVKCLLLCCVTLTLSCMCDNDTYLYVCTHIATCMCDTDAYLYVCTQIATCMCVHR